MSKIDDREREIRKLGKAAITMWLFSGLFGIIIIVGSTRPESFYVGLLLLGVNFSIMIIYIMWKIAGILDEIVGKKVVEPILVNQIKPTIVIDAFTSEKEQPKKNNTMIIGGGLVLGLVLYVVTIII